MLTQIDIEYDFGFRETVEIEDGEQFVMPENGRLIEARICLTDDPDGPYLPVYGHPPAGSPLYDELAAIRDFAENGAVCENPGYEGTIENLKLPEDL